MNTLGSICGSRVAYSISKRLCQSQDSEPCRALHGRKKEIPLSLPSMRRMGTYQQDAGAMNDSNNGC